MRIVDIAKLAKSELINAVTLTGQVSNTDITVKALFSKLQEVSGVYTFVNTDDASVNLSDGTQRIPLKGTTLILGINNTDNTTNALLISTLYTYSLSYDASAEGEGTIRPFTDSASLQNVLNQLNNKVDKVSGKGLSTNDLTTALKSNYDTAYSQRHTHRNKSMLDKIDISYGITTHWFNIPRVSGFTATEILTNDWDDTLSGKTMSVKTSGLFHELVAQVSTKKRYVASGEPSLYSLVLTSIPVLFTPSSSIVDLSGYLCASVVQIGTQVAKTSMVPLKTGNSELQNTYFEMPFIYDFNAFDQVQDPDQVSYFMVYLYVYASGHCNSTSGGDIMIQSGNMDTFYVTQMCT